VAELVFNTDRCYKLIIFFVERVVSQVNKHALVLLLALHVDFLVVFSGVSNDSFLVHVNFQWITTDD
jgi:hypothetical protein